MNTYSRSDLCPVDFITSSQTARRLGIVSDDLEMSVELWDASNINTQGNEAYLGGRGRIKGTIVALYDLDQQPAYTAAVGDIPPIIVAGRRGRLLCYLAGAAIGPLKTGTLTMPPVGRPATIPGNFGLPPPAVSAQFLSLPVRIKAVRYAWALEKAVGWAFDVVGDFLDDSNQPRFVTFPVGPPI